jgi:DNA-binding NarL/FixJ family response regulator
MSLEQTKIKLIRLYTVEEDDIYFDLCKAVLKLKAPIELLGVSNSHDIGALRQAMLTLSPDVVLVSINDLESDIIKKLEQMRMDFPKIGIVLLLGFYNAHNIKQLRRLALLSGVGGTALFLKQQQDKMEWLCTAISAVSQGKVILDAPLAAFMFAGKSSPTFLKQFTLRELEILNLLANGYTNSAIAATLYIDIKTVECHLNKMYSKLKEDYELGDKHLRVSAAKLYLEAIDDSGGNENWIVRSSVNQMRRIDGKNN